MDKIILDVANFKKLCNTQSVLHGNLGYRDFARLDLISGGVSYNSKFFFDHGRMYLLLKIEGTLSSTCQRCLTEVAIDISIEQKLTPVLTDKEAKYLEEREIEADPILLDNPNLSLVTLVEDELILIIPSFVSHQSCHMAQVENKISDDDSHEFEERGTYNPFSQLKMLQKHNNEGI